MPVLPSSLTTIIICDHTAIAIAILQLFNACIHRIAIAIAAKGHADLDLKV